MKSLLEANKLLEEEKYKVKQIYEEKLRKELGEFKAHFSREIIMLQNKFALSLQNLKTKLCEDERDKLALEIV